jgi:hypothetical protein
MAQYTNVLRPLCPAHYERMIVAGDTDGREASDVSLIETHGCTCPQEGCSQMYSLSLGYFKTKLSDDYWHTTGSPSLRVERNTTQVICGEHKSAMFIEEFIEGTKRARFRCPVEDCISLMDIQVDGPPVYWLGEGYFESAYLD